MLCVIAAFGPSMAVVLLSYRSCAPSAPARVSWAGWTAVAVRGPRSRVARRLPASTLDETLALAAECTAAFATANARVPAVSHRALQGFGSVTSALSSAIVLHHGNRMHELQGQSGGGESMTHRARRLLHARVTELRLRDNEVANAELEELMHALERIEAGTWGQCEKCAKAIGRDRLRALPETRCCLQCARG